MDLQQITDVTQLKAMAYDQLVTKEQAEVNLQSINKRIIEIQQQAQDNQQVKKPEESKKQ